MVQQSALRQQNVLNVDIFDAGTLLNYRHHLSLIEFAILLDFFIKNLFSTFAA